MSSFQRLDTFEQLHIVSDLHIGGPPGGRIFGQPEVLAQVVNHLASVDPARAVGLILNGDIVDFLLGPDAVYFDPITAVAKLERAFAPPFRQVLEALARFVDRPNRRLILVIGNHDLELALPESQAWLTHELTKQSEESERARARISWCLDGCGYAALVGGHRVFVVHGNDVDEWNVVDHEALRKVVKATTMEVDPVSWSPNGGTSLVVDVINRAKEQYAFVDLLKPETPTGPVGEILATLPLRELPFNAALRSYARKHFDRVRMKWGWLSAPDAAAIASAQPGATGMTGASYLEDAQRELDAGREPTDLIGLDADAILGLANILFRRIEPGGDVNAALRTSLEQHLSEVAKTFDVGTEDETFEALDRACGPAAFVVAGHTHLERSIQRRRFSGHYFNSGTWIRLIRLKSSWLKEPEFTQLLDALHTGTLERLVQGGYTTCSNTVVAIERRGNEVIGELRHGHSAPAGTEPWEAVPNTQRRFTVRGE
ncbi:MAG: metallophosphoesterase [Deltaproteobacteria bacterium]|nr:metallophosphoesterase [Deltaproteobacteria bacterium]